MPLATPKVMRSLCNGTAMLSLACAGAASAVGLGEINVDSGLHERFAASIPLLTPTDEQRKSLSVHIANADAFQRAGIERTDYLSTLRFRLLDTPNGTVVLIDSDEIIAEPFLNLIVQADWGNGSLLREYSVLFDPPKDLDPVGPAAEKSAAVAADAGAPAKAAEPAPAVAEAANTTATAAAGPTAAPTTAAPTTAAPTAAAAAAAAPAAAPPAAAPVAAAPSVAAAAAAAPVAAAPTSAAPAMAIAAQNAATTMPAPAAQAATPTATATANGFQYGPVRFHEQPRSIAARLHPNAAVSRDQVELALFKANPQAFAQGRLDRLIPGSMLSIPSPGLIEAASPAAATAAIIELRAHPGASQSRNAAARKALAAAYPSGGAPAKAAPPVLARAAESRVPAVPQIPVPAPVQAPVPVPAIASAPPAPLQQAATSQPQQPSAPAPATAPAKPVVAAAPPALAPPVPAPVYADAGKPADALRLRMAAWLVWACSGLSLLAALAMLLANTRSQSRSRGGSRVDPARSAKVASARLASPARPAMAFSPPPAAAIPAIQLQPASPVQAPLSASTRSEAPASTAPMAEMAPAADVSPSVPAEETAAASQIDAAAPAVDSGVDSGVGPGMDPAVAEHTPSEPAVDGASVLAEAELCQLYGQFAGAAALLEGAVRQVPSDAKLRLKLAEAYYAAGMVEEFERAAAGLRGLDLAMQQSLDEMKQTLSARTQPAQSPLPASTPAESAATLSGGAASVQAAALPIPSDTSAADAAGPQADDGRLPTDPVIEQLQWFLDEPAKPQAKTGPEAPHSVARLPKNRRRSRAAKRL